MIENAALRFFETEPVTADLEIKEIMDTITAEMSTKLLLVVDKEKPSELVGVFTPFDLL